MIMNHKGGSIMRKYLIALDDGHGMETAGKRTPYIQEIGRFIRENEFNRAVVNFLDIELKRCGFDTLWLAPTDKDTPLKARTDLANSKKADLLVSIHYNGFDGVFNGNDPEGLSIHIYPNSKESRKVAECILKYLKTGTPQKNRGIQEDNFHMLREAKMPAILSENGFMDNKREALLMIDESFQKEVAIEHAKGICDYFRVKYIDKITPKKEEIIMKKIENVDEALKVLVENGVVNSPDYWKTASNMVKHFDLFILNVANKLKEKESGK
jgi:N-acetylmuramoyl-L-alanine amidase